eukprot:ANDGO_05994.mRNA.1 hypothetical protein
MSSESGFDIKLSSAGYLVRNNVVHSVEAETNVLSNGSLLDDVDASRPLAFPIPSTREVRIDVSEIDIEDHVWTRSSRVRLLVVGDARVGKTSLIKNLSSGGTLFDPTEKSTEVGDVRTLEISIRKHVWTDSTEGKQTTLLSRLMNRYVAEQIQELRSPLRNTDGSSTLQPSTVELPVISPASPQVADAEGEVEDVAESIVTPSSWQPSPNVAREKVTARERIDVTARVLTDLDGDTLSVSVLDFAGQNVFRVFDPLFFGKQSLYFCVFSLRDLYVAHQTGTLEKAIESNIISWLRIIANLGACHASKEQKLMSKVVLIGTHGNSYATFWWEKVRCSLSSREWNWQKTFLDACNACLGKVLKKPQFNAFFEIRQFSNDRWFIVVENDRRQRKNGQKPMMEWLSKTIEDFHRRLPKVLLRNLVLEQMCRDCKDVILAVDSIRDRIPGIASVCKTNAEVKSCFDDLVALGCFFACSSDGHMIVLRPDVFIRTCAQLIPPTDGKGGLQHVGHSKSVVYKDLLENAGIVQFEIAKTNLEEHLRTNKFCPADSHRLVAEQVIGMLVTLGVVVPMDQESKLVFFPQWYRHCDLHSHAQDTLDTRWKSICSNSAAAAPVSLSVRCVGDGVLTGMFDGVVTDLHFWRFITYLGTHSLLFPLFSRGHPPAFGLDVIVGYSSSSVQCRIRLDREEGVSSIFHFDILSDPHATEVPDFVELLDAFLKQDPMSKSVLSCEEVVLVDGVYEPTSMFGGGHAQRTERSLRPNSAPSGDTTPFSGGSPNDIGSEHISIRSKAFLQDANPREHASRFLQESSNAIQNLLSSIRLGKTREDIDLWNFASQLKSDESLLNSRLRRFNRFFESLSTAICSTWATLFQARSNELPSLNLVPKSELCGSIGNQTALFDPDMDMVVILNSDLAARVEYNASLMSATWPHPANKPVQLAEVILLGNIVAHALRNVLQEQSEGSEMVVLESCRRDGKIRFSVSLRDPHNSDVAQVDVLPALQTSTGMFLLLDGKEGKFKTSRNISARREIEELNKFYKGFCDVIKVLKLVNKMEAHHLNLQIPSCAFEQAAIAFSSNILAEAWNSKTFMELFQGCLRVILASLQRTGTAARFPAPNDPDSDVLRRLREEENRSTKEAYIELLDSWIALSPSNALDLFKRCKSRYMSQ